MGIRTLWLVLLFIGSLVAGSFVVIETDMSPDENT